MTKRTNERSVRSKHITLRITQAEKEKIFQNAAGRSLSCYVRDLIFSRGSRPTLSRGEQHCIKILTLLSEKVGEHIETVASATSLRRSDVTNLLKEISDEVDSIRIGILEGGPA